MFLAAPAVPDVPEPEPSFYELEAEGYIQLLAQCEEEVEDYQTEAADKSRRMWKSEADSSNQHLASRREIRLLEDRAHVLQRNLEHSEARETLTRRAATEQMARIESCARVSAQEACDLRQESAHYEERMIEDAVITRRCWESQAREQCEAADQRAV